MSAQKVNLILAANLVRELADADSTDRLTIDHLIDKAREMCGLRPVADDDEQGDE
jgi:hypothetical protein